MEKFKGIILLSVLLMTVWGYAQTTRYVKSVATGDGSGSSWDNASDDLQLMINESSDGDKIFVATGTYKPIRPADDLDTIDLNNRKNAFVLKSGVKIYGGFAGTETSPQERDLSNPSNQSILSGDFNDDDAVTGDASSLTIAGNEENAYRIVMNIGNNTDTLLDSFIIQGANTTLGDITVNGVTISNKYGGGMYFWNSKTTLLNCIFTQNTAERGGGIHIGGSSLDPKISNCIFVKNIATGGGSAIYNIRRPRFSNCTVWGNRSLGGSNYSSVWSGTGNFYFRNCIAYGNNGGFVNGTSQVHIYNSLIQGMTSTSNSNINGNTNPLFVNPDNGDFSLQPGSPVINKGNNSYVPSDVITDIVGNLRMMDCVVDLGAYEYDSSLIIVIDEAQSFCEGSNIDLSPIVNIINTAGFTEEFSSENWQLASSNSNGSITFSPDGTSLEMISSNNNSGSMGYNQISISLPADVIVSFDWSYSTDDLGGTPYDYPKFILNGAESNFQGFNSSLNQSGTHTIIVNGGSVFGFKMISSDNAKGSATVNITNFVINTDYSYQWTASDGGVINDEGDQLSLTVDTAGTYTLTITTAYECAISKTIEVSEIPKNAPEGEVKQSLSEGQTLADLEVVGENLTWYTDEELTTAIPDTTQVVFGENYYVTQTIEECESEALIIKVKSVLSGSCDSYTIWNGSVWSNGAPDTTKRAIIEGDLTLTEDVTACEVLLNSGTLTVSSGATLTVNGVIENTQ
ncbi:MAG: choice-of-anchor Q domain-containing protein, partial [Flavobacteriaceae bacterium]